MASAENSKYCVISYRWKKGFKMKEVPKDEDPDNFLAKQSNLYCSVMFVSHDRGQEWSIYKQQGVGAIEKIIQAQSDYLPRPSKTLIRQGSFAPTSDVSIKIPSKFGGGFVTVASDPDDLVLQIKLATIETIKINLSDKHKRKEKLISKNFGLGIEESGKFVELLSEEQILSKKSISSDCTLVLVYLKDLGKHAGKGKGRWRMRGEEKKKDDENRNIRRRIAIEVLESEQAYVKNLKHIIDHYIQPLHILNQNKQDLILKKNEMNILFSNIIDIYKLNQEFCRKLEERLGQWDANSGFLQLNLDKQMLGDVFMIIAPELKIYSTYVANHEKAIALLKVLESNSKFQDFCKSIDDKKASNAQSLVSKLNKPIQRIPKYKLLLQEILKNTPITHNDYANLHKAVQLINDIALKTNQECQAQEERLKIRQFEEECDPKPDLISGNPYRRLMKRDRIIIDMVTGQTAKSIVVKTTYEFILFNDLIVIAALKKKGLRSSKLSILEKISLDENVAVHNPKSKRSATFRGTKGGSKKFDGISLSCGGEKGAKVYVITAEEEKTVQEWGLQITACLRRLSDRKCHEEEKIKFRQSSSSNEQEILCERCGAIFSGKKKKKEHQYCKKCNRVVCDQCSKSRQRVGDNKEKWRVCDDCKHILKFEIAEIGDLSRCCYKAAEYKIKVFVFAELAKDKNSDSKENNLPLFEKPYVFVTKTFSDFKTLEKKIKERIIDDEISTEFKLPEDYLDNTGFVSFLMTLAKSPLLEEDVAIFLGIPVEKWKPDDLLEEDHSHSHIQNYLSVIDTPESRVSIHRSFEDTVKAPLLSKS